jgi:phospholipid/cholesterol/gamma-HCH transport system substrate-binding protein
MSKHVSKVGLAMLIPAVVFALVLYVVLNNAFGGPQLRTSTPYELKASFADSQGLLKKSFVLARGVDVGSVEGIQVQGDRALITFSIASRYAPIHRDATVQIGNRTLIGEPYLNLDPGTPAAGTFPSGSTLSAREVLPQVEFDQALQALDTPTLAHLRSTSLTFARGFASPDAPAEVSSAFGGLSDLVHQLRLLTDTLSGQAPEISSLVRDGGAVLGQLGEREASVRAIVSGGRATLAALASRQQALASAIGETPALLQVGRKTLADLQPLLEQARPLIADVRTAAPDLTPTFNDLQPVAREATQVVAGLPQLDGAALPALHAALPVVQGASPLATRLLPTLENLIPVLDYLQPRTNDVAALLSNLAEFADHGDARGTYLRYEAIDVPGISDGTKGLEGKTFQLNAYPSPNGNSDPQGYTGTYPHLMPFLPPAH